MEGGTVGETKRTSKIKLTPKCAVFSVVRSGVGDEGEPNWMLAVSW